MTFYQLLRLQREFLLRLHSVGIKTSDAELVDLLGEYEEMRGKEKTSYIVAYLADKYGKGERTVWRIIKRLGGECHELSA